MEAETRLAQQREREQAEKDLAKAEEEAASEKRLIEADERMEAERKRLKSEKVRHEQLDQVWVRNSDCAANRPGMDSRARLVRDFWVAAYPVSTHSSWSAQAQTGRGAPS